jgi:hypothetical protein
MVDQKHNLDLSLCRVQGLDVNHEKRLCPNNIVIFYENLQHVSNLQNNNVHQIWNSNKFGAQVGHNDDVFVLTKTRLKKMHTIILD